MNESTVYRFTFAGEDPLPAFGTLCVLKVDAANCAPTVLNAASTIDETAITLRIPVPAILSFSKWAPNVLRVITATMRSPVESHTQPLTNNSQVKAEKSSMVFSTASPGR
jgi:hypothetical protein